MGAGLQRPGRLTRGLAATLTVVALVSMTPPVLAQLEAQFAPPARDFGVDGDGDGSFNLLRVQADVTVYEAGLFSFSAVLFSGDGLTYIDSAGASRYLDRSDSVDFDFAADEIQGAGLDGPYVVRMTMRNGTYAAVDFLNHTTGAYLLSDFDQLGFAFLPPHADAGLDTDGDSLFDVLEVRLNANVRDPGLYRVYGAIPRGTTSRVETVVETVPLAVGPQVVALSFTGWKLWAAADGPYVVQAWAWGPSGGTGIIFHTTQAYMRTDFDPPPVVLSPPHWDEGVDADSDGRFNALRVHSNLTVQAGSLYLLTGTLSDGAGNAVAYASASESLVPGVREVLVDFPGTQILWAARDGPYRVDLEAYIGDALAGSAVHWTSAYSAADFGPFPAALSPPHSDRGVDVDGDGLYDFLEIQAHVNVSIPGDHTLTVFVYGIGNGRATRWLLPGPQRIDVLFEGSRIRQYRQNGPYTVEVRTTDVYGTTIERGEFTTGFYDWQTFEPPPVSLLPPHGDGVLDSDGDGLYETLRVSVRLDAGPGGLVTVAGSAYANYTYLDGAYETRAVGPGVQTLSLDFRGWRIREWGRDGPYRIEFYATRPGAFYGSGTHQTAAYRAADFDTRPARLVPPFEDAAIDTDRDGVFDALRIRVGVDVTSTAPYRVDAYLYDSHLAPIEESVFAKVIEAGNTTADLDFGGGSISAGSHDGVFLVSVYLRDFHGNSLASDGLVTRRYSASSFRPADRTRFPAPPVDVGVDDDGNGLYEAIALDISVSVSEVGWYAVSVSLTTRGGWTSLGWVSDLRMLGGGLQTRRYTFPTAPMVLGWLDGPYDASFSLWRDGEPLELLDTAWHRTAPYTLSQLDVLPVALASPHADAAVDRDVPPDGLADVLRVDVSLEVRRPASFAVQGTLWDGTRSVPIASDTRVLSLSPGVHAVPLFFPGVRIRASGHDGPYLVTLDLPLNRYPWYSLGAGRHLTGAYRAVDFEPFTPADVGGVVRVAGSGGIVPFADVMAYNYEDGSIGGFYEEATGLADYRLSLYEGDWILVADAGEFQGTSVGVRVTAPTTVQDLLLAPVRNSPRIVEYTFPGWDVLDARATGIAETDNATARQRLEWSYGDRDGFLSWSEFNTSRDFAYEESEFLPPWTVDALRVDDIFYERVPGSRVERHADVEGRWDNPRPIRREETRAYVANATIPLAATHTLAVRVRLDRDEDFVYRITLPLGYVVASVLAPPEVAVTGQGTAFLVLDPVPDPAEYDGLDSFWMTIAVRAQDDAPPVISSTGAAPDPVEFGGGVTISATATDLAGIASVTVEVRDWSNAVVGTFAMTSAGGGRFEYEYTPADLGTYTYSITATDTFGNTASAGGAFVSEDTTNPSADAGQDESVETGEEVRFNGSGSTDNHGIVNWSWTFTEGAERVTLYRESSTHMFSAAGEYEVTLRVTDESENWDEDVVTITVIAPPGGGTAGPPAWAWLAVVIVAALAAVLLLRRRRRPAAMPPENPPAAPAPTPATPPASARLRPPRRPSLRPGRSRPVDGK